MVRHITYDVCELCFGYIIVQKQIDIGADGVIVNRFYLKSIYKGKPRWSLDYAHAKAYKSEGAALKVINQLDKELWR